ncbi:MAG: pseudouridine synthase [Bacteroidales bacterium]
MERNNNNRSFGKPERSRSSESSSHFSKPDWKKKTDGNTERSASSFKPKFGDRDSKPSYGDRKDKPTYGERKEGGFKPKFGDRDSKPSYGDRGDKPRYGDRSTSSDRPAYPKRDDRPAYGEKREGSFKPKFGDRDSKPSYGDRGDKPRYSDRSHTSSDRPSYPKRDDRPSYGEKREGGFKPKFGDRDSKPSYGDRGDKSGYGDRDQRSSERPSYPKRDDRPAYGERKEGGFKPKFGDRDSKPSYGDRGDKPDFKPRREGDASSNPVREYKKGYQKDDRPFSEKKRSYDDDSSNDRFLHRNKPRRRTSEIDLPVRERPKRADVLELKNFKSTNRPDAFGPVRLNKYIANAGICSRREADDLIISGAVAINGVIITELGTKVNPGDAVQYGGETLVSEKKKYVLLNKPKGYITTVDDPQERRTVMALVKDACKERLYPVGRLDRNTSGLLLFTNDGEIAKKLTHPRYGVKKLYQVELDRALSKSDMERLWDGVELEDGIVKVDDVAYVDEAKNKKEIGIEIHTGKNRVIRRLFEAMGYEVVKLDRTMFAGLTKKDIPRGMWRFLSEKEVSYLKMLQ